MRRRDQLRHALWRAVGHLDNQAYLACCSWSAVIGRNVTMTSGVVTCLRCVLKHEHHAYGKYRLLGAATAMRHTGEW